MNRCDAKANVTTLRKTIRNRIKGINERRALAELLVL